MKSMSNNERTLQYPFCLFYSYLGEVNAQKPRKLGFLFDENAEKVNNSVNCSLYKCKFIMAWKDAKEFVETFKTDPKKALGMLLVIALIIIIGVWAKAIGDRSVRFFTEITDKSKPDPCETVNPRELPTSVWLKCQKSKNKGE